MRIRSLTAWSIAIGSAVLPSLCLADVPPELRKTLESRYPEVKVLDVQPSPLAGLYEVFLGDSIVYSDATGDYLLLGSLMDTKNQRDLTLERVDALNAIDFESLPLDRAIKVVKGNGKRRLAVFSDPDCPYCRQLEKEMTELTDITVYTFLFPIAEIHPDATPKSRAIWCSPDRSQAWSAWMTEGKPPAPGSTCKDDPVDELQELGRKLRVGSTPTLYLADGKRVMGTRPAKELDSLLDAASAPRATASAAADTPHRQDGSSPRQAR